MKKFNNTKFLAASIAVAMFAVTQSVIISHDRNGAAAYEIPQVEPRSMHVEQVAEPIVNDAAIPDISVADGTVGVGDVVSLPITLSDAPEGLSGYYLEVSLSDTSVASISSVELPDLGMTFDLPTADGGILISAVDLYRAIEFDALDTTLATVSVTGLREGLTDVELKVIQMDDDFGGLMETEVFAGTVNVN